MLNYLCFIINLVKRMAAYRVCSVCACDGVGGGERSSVQTAV